VITAPSKDPVAFEASATAIIKTTYNQPITTKYTNRFSRGPAWGIGKLDLRQLAGSRNNDTLRG
jgi:hypothetical protein